MKVLVVFSSDVPGGAEISLSRMALASKRVSYDLCTFGGDRHWSKWIKSQGGNPIILGGADGILRLFSFPIAVIRLVVLLSRFDYDVVYVCGTRLAIILRFVLVLFPRIKFVHAVRWNPNAGILRDRVLRIAERWTGFLVDSWICNSETAKKTLCDMCNISPDRIFVIYNGVEFPDSMPDISGRSDEILTVANISERKGYIEYLHTIKKVVQSIPELKFVFVGRDDMNGKLQAEIQKLGLSEVVRYDGYQSDLSSWYSSARIFVLPSKGSEGCPTSILEAHSFGIPVIAYNVDGVPEIVEDTVDGYLYDIDDSSIGQGILRLVSNPMTIESMGMSGREKVKHNFTIQACADNHAKVFMLICR